MRAQGTNQLITQLRTTGAGAETQGRLPPNLRSTHHTTLPPQLLPRQTRNLLLSGPSKLREHPYRVVQDHHAIQQSGQGIKSTSIQT